MGVPFGQKLTVAFRNFANAPKNMDWEIRPYKKSSRMREHTNGITVHHEDSYRKKS